MITVLKMIAPLVVAALIVLSVSCETTTQSVANIAQYRIDSLAVPDSVKVNDTLQLGLGIFLDCTNTVTRIDTTYRNEQFTVAVFGTVFTGPGPRPLCPAHFTTTIVLLTTAHRGVLTISALQPSGQALADSVVVY